MTIIQIIFYAYALVATVSALMVIAAPNPVRGTLFLVVTFVAMSGIWLLLQAEFLALILVLVYVGAVMTLFLFVVMMLRVNVVRFKEGFVRILPLAILMVVLMIGLILMVVSPKYFGLSEIPSPAPTAANYSNSMDLGMVLYTNYAYPFEIAAVILLAAIVAAISLAHRVPRHRKKQNPSEQIAVKKADRLRLVK